MRDDSVVTDVAEGEGIRTIGSTDEMFGLGYTVEFSRSKDTETQNNITLLYLSFDENKIKYIIS